MVGHRSLLSGRRILVVLDNARDSDQVRPLLPGDSGCAASRDRIIQRCGGLPLALALVCARPASALPELDAETDGTSGLDAFAVAGVKHDLRTVLSWSYRQLSPELARLFCLLALHPGPDIPVAAAAAVAGHDRATARRLLHLLADTHLVTEHRPGRFALHDLIREYATENAHRDLGAADRDAAGRRLLDFYLYSCHNATWILFPHRLQKITGAPPGGVRPITFDGRATAVRWLDEEYDALAALAWSCRAADRRDYLPLFIWALAAYQQDVKPRLLSIAYTISGEYEIPTPEQAREAYPYAAEALEIYTDDEVGRANALHLIGWYHAYQPDGDPAARRAFHECVELAQRVEYPAGVASGYTNLGQYLQYVGDLPAAIAAYERAESVDGGTDFIRAHALAGLYLCHRRLGDDAAAGQARDTALRLLPMFPPGSAESLRRLLDADAAAAPA